MMLYYIGYMVEKLALQEHLLQHLRLLIEYKLK